MPMKSKLLTLTEGQLELLRNESIKTGNPINAVVRLAIMDYFNKEAR